MICSADGAFGTEAPLNNSSVSQPIAEKGHALHTLIHRHLRKLVTIIEPDCGLLEELLSMDVLDEIQFAGVQGAANIYEQNNRLLQNFMSESDEKCQQFLSALRNTKQQHVANYITHDGG